MENKSSSFELSKNLTKVYIVTHLDKEYIENNISKKVEIFDEIDSTNNTFTI